MQLEEKKKKKAAESESNLLRSVQCCTSFFPLIYGKVPFSLPFSWRIFILMFFKRADAQEREKGKKEKERIESSAKKI